MTKRIVKILGWGTGESQAKITAILDGTTVFSGDVELEEMTKENESIHTAPTLFTFEIPIDFVGIKHMAIDIQKAAVRFGQIAANYTEVQMGEIVYSTGADIYADIAEFDGAGICDPRSNITIDGKKCEADRAIGLGTWHWTVEPGSTFEHDLTVITAGVEE